MRDRGEISRSGGAACFDFCIFRVTNRYKLQEYSQQDPLQAKVEGGQQDTVPRTRPGTTREFQTTNV